MKRVFTILFTALFCSTLLPIQSQSIADFCDNLSLFDIDESAEFARYVNISIREDSTATKALAAMVLQSSDEESGEPIKVSKQGYRIGIFFDNSPSARAKANGVKSLCDSLFADIPSSMSYDNPYFKVSAGYCMSQEEAVIMLHRIQKHFPRAYLMREEITPANIVASYNAEQEVKRRIAEAEMAKNVKEMEDGEGDESDKERSKNSKSRR